MLEGVVSGGRRVEGGNAAGVRVDWGDLVTRILCLVGSVKCFSEGVVRGGRRVEGGNAAGAGGLGCLVTSTLVDVSCL